MNDRLLLRVNDAAQILGLSRSKVYELIARGEIKVVHIGAAVRVPSDELRAFVAKLTAQAGAAR